MSGWQPIETAPRIAAIRLWDGERQFDGRWQGGCWIEFNNGDYHDGGYGQAYRHDGHDRPIPTHWHSWKKPPEPKS